MNIRFYKPCSAGTRHRSISQFSENKINTCKYLKYGIQRSFGRNNRGVITLRHRGGGHKLHGRRVQHHGGLLRNVHELLVRPRLLWPRGQPAVHSLRRR